MKKSLLLLTVVVLLLGACASPAPEATPTPVATPIPAPTNTPASLATPTSPALAETSFIEPIRKQIFDELVDAQGGISGNEEARATVARQWGISVGAAEEILLEGLMKGWLMPSPTPVPPTPVPPTATATPWPTATPRLPTPTPTISAEEKTYVEALKNIGTVWLAAYFTLEDLVEELGEDPELLLDWVWQDHVKSLVKIMGMAGRAVDELNPPSRLEGVHQSFVRAFEHSDRGGVLFNWGIENTDSGKIAEGWAELVLGIGYIEETAGKW